MNHLYLLQRTGLILMFVCASSMVFPQNNPAYSFTNQQLRNAGWTDKQIAELRASEPKSEARRISGKPKQPEPLVSYSSVFEKYVPFDHVPEIGWREANDRVGEIGGWRAYLKIVQDAAKPEAESTEGN